MIFFNDNKLNISKDSAINAEARSRYMDGWQRARTEQHVQMINDVEASPTNSIEYYKHRMDSEQRVHHEIELLLNIKIGVSVILSLDHYRYIKVF